MRRFRWTVMVVILTASALTGALADPVVAAESDVASDVFGQPLDEFLSAFPNAERRADGTYQLEPGVRLVPPSAAAASEEEEWPSDCWDHWFCAWQDKEFGGWGIRWYACDTIDLDPPYRNAISSMHNAQNSLTAWFADVGEYPRQGTLGPNSYWRNMTVNHWNDRIDIIDPC